MNDLMPLSLNGTAVRKHADGMTARTTGGLSALIHRVWGGLSAGSRSPERLCYGRACSKAGCRLHSPPHTPTIASW
jgi:hypothetical protein